MNERPTDDRLTKLTLPLSARLIDAAYAIRENRTRCAIVLSDDRVVGVISEGDILRALLHGAEVHAPVADWISHGFKFLGEADLQAAFELMRRHGITLVPVIDADFRLQDAISLADVLEKVDLRER